MTGRFLVVAAFLLLALGFLEWWMRVLRIVVVLMVALTATVDAQWWRWGRPKSVAVPQEPSGGGGGALTLTYVGAWRFPQTTNGASAQGYNFGPTGLAYDTSSNTFFAGDSFNHLAEISNPTPLTGAVSGLNTATYVQNFADAFDGSLTSEGPYDPNEPTIQQGVYVQDATHIVVTAVRNYDGGLSGGNQREGHYRRPRNLSTAGTGLWHTVAGDHQQGLVAGFMAPYSGGMALTGNCCLSVITRTSYGPSAWVFDPSSDTNTGATPLVYYPDAHRTLGEWSSQNTYYGAVTQANHMVVIDDKLVFIGVNGRGPYCYGFPTHDKALAGTQVPGFEPEIYCYDMHVTDKGQLNSEYYYQIWSYTLSDLATGSPWDHIPTIQDLVTPYTPGTNRLYKIGGIAYNPATRLLYVAQREIDLIGCCGVLPVMLVYHVEP